MTDSKLKEQIKKLQSIEEKLEGNEKEKGKLKNELPGLLDEWLIKTKALGKGMWRYDQEPYTKNFRLLMSTPLLNPKLKDMMDAIEYVNIILRPDRKSRDFNRGWVQEIKISQTRFRDLVMNIPESIELAELALLIDRYGLRFNFDGMIQTIKVLRDQKPSQSYEADRIEREMNKIMLAGGDIKHPMSELDVGDRELPEPILQVEEYIGRWMHEKFVTCVMAFMDPDDMDKSLMVDFDLLDSDIKVVFVMLAKALYKRLQKMVREDKSLVRWK
jgi:hypothetical protein